MKTSFYKCYTIFLSEIGAKLDPIIGVHGKIKVNNLCVVDSKKKKKRKEREKQLSSTIETTVFKDVLCPKMFKLQNKHCTHL